MQKVQASVALLGYRRNDRARTLRDGRSDSIGLVLENVADPFDATLMNSVEEAALERRKLLLVGSIHRGSGLRAPGRETHDGQRVRWLLPLGS